MRHARFLRALVLAAASLGVAGCAVQDGSGHRPAVSADQPVKVVYHFTNGLEEASRGLGNIRNHLAADPKAKIVVVGNGLGIDFMLDGAKDRNGNPFDIAIQELKAKGVDFRLCQNTIVRRNIDRSKVLPEVSIVPSGVAEAARLQAREGYVYLRP
jgi:intracellular sulfur oxidation DsrE/DsrF family protein